MDLVSRIADLTRKTFVYSTVTAELTRRHSKTHPLSDRTVCAFVPIPISQGSFVVACFRKA